MTITAFTKTVLVNVQIHSKYEPCYSCYSPSFATS